MIYIYIRIMIYIYVYIMIYMKWYFIYIYIWYIGLSKNGIPYMFSIVMVLYGPCGISVYHFCPHTIGHLRVRFTSILSIPPFSDTLSLAQQGLLPCPASAFFSTLSMTCPRSVVTTRRARLLFWPWFGPWDRREQRPTWEPRRSRLATENFLLMLTFEAILWHPSSKKGKNKKLPLPIPGPLLRYWCLVQPARRSAAAKIFAGSCKVQASMLQNFQPVHVWANGLCFTGAPAKINLDSNSRHFSRP